MNCSDNNGRYCDLCDLCHSIASAEDFCAVMDTLARGSLKMIEAQASMVALLDEKRQMLEIGASAGWNQSLAGEAAVSLSQSPVDSAAIEGQVVQVEDLLKETGWFFRQRAIDEGLRSLLAIPLSIGLRSIGVLHLCRQEPGPFSGSQKALARTMATQAGLALQKLRAVQQARVLGKIAQAINSSLDQQQVLQTIVEQASAVLGFKAAAIRILDEEGRLLEEKAAYGLSEAYRSKGPVELDKSPLDQETFAGEAVVVTNSQLDLKLQYPDDVRREGIRSILCVPLRIRNQPVGVLRVYSSAMREFTADEVDFLKSLASQGGIAMENARLFEHLRRDYEDLRQAVWKWYDWGERPPRM